MSTGVRPYLSHFFAQLYQSGVHDVVIAPGSRSTPLALLIKELPFRVTVALDERSGAFFALGLSKASRHPVAVVCTSGTAVANLYPSVAEAHLSRVPLILLTADRPRELRDVGAAQTIDQVRLFGQHVKWFLDLPTPGPSELEPYAAQVASRAVHMAVAHPEGPVHLNFPLREPLLPEAGPIASPLMGPIFSPEMAPAPEAVSTAAAWIAEASRPVLALGPESPPISADVLEQAGRHHWPVFIDPVAGSGRMRASLTAYDTLIRHYPSTPPPDLVVRLGAPLTSKAFTQWAAAARLILLDWSGGFRDPLAQSHLVIEGDPVRSLARLITASQPPQEDYLTQLLALDRQAALHLTQVLSQARSDFEGHFYAELDALWSPKAMPLLLASSMPIRDFDTFSRQARFPVYANRGAHGIDGLNSTALGIARHWGDVLAVLADLAFHHDLTGLVYASQYDLSAFIVIINNAGGAIFSHLPQNQLDRPLFEELFGTPHRMDFRGAAQLYGASFRRATSYAEFRSHFLDMRDQPGLRVLEWLTTPREESWHIHRRLYRPGGEPG
jgi:2-succinyl-5-enolpyruvyl-6-hydroxy-3-cyclohexene-1-carboxylate synthase